MENFADRLVAKMKEKKSVICVGLDPQLDMLPKFLLSTKLEQFSDKFQAAAEAVLEFNKVIIDAIYDLVPVVKPQIAFYEMLGVEGLRVFKETCAYAKSKGLLVLADVKRGDIGSTVEAYSKAFLSGVEIAGSKESVFDVDAITVNPYLGYDGIKPFITDARKMGKGIFILVKTSNASSGDFQDLELRKNESLYETVGHFVEAWGADDIGESGYSFVGAVVGATFPSQAQRLRSIMPNSIFLVPGYGAQGGTAEDLKPCFNEDGMGALINSSRGIIYAYKTVSSDIDYGQASRGAVKLMLEDLANAGISIK